MKLESGQNAALADQQIKINVQLKPSSSALELDASAYLLAANGKVLSDAGMVFFGQLSALGGAVALDVAARSFTIDLARVPVDIQKIAITLTIDKGNQRQQRFGMLENVELRCAGSSTAYEYLLSTQSMGETAVILAELYRRDASWKIRAVGQGFVGGLGPLARHFGVDISDDPDAASNAAPPKPAAAPPPIPPEPQAPPPPAAAPSMPPPPPAPIRLEKITLEKRKPISLQKAGGAFGEIVVNLNWSRAQPGFFGAMKKAIDLDLGCMIELQNGRKALVQALGNAFGNYGEAPFARLLADDRTGAAVDGEFIKINGDSWSQIKRMLIFAFIYEGAPSWSKADGVVSLKVPGQPELITRLDSHSDRHTMCAVAGLENVAGAIQVTKLVEYFPAMLRWISNTGLGFVGLRVVNKGQYARDHCQFSATKRLLRDHEPRLCERSEAISSFSLAALRLLHFVRNDEVVRLYKSITYSFSSWRERSEAISSFSRAALRLLHCVRNDDAFFREVHGER